VRHGGDCDEEVEEEEEIAEPQASADPGSADYSLAQGVKIFRLGGEGLCGRIICVLPTSVSSALPTCFVLPAMASRLDEYTTFDPTNATNPPNALAAELVPGGWGAARQR